MLQALTEWHWRCIPSASLPYPETPKHGFRSTWKPWFVTKMWLGHWLTSRLTCNCGCQLHHANRNEWYVFRIVVLWHCSALPVVYTCFHLCYRFVRVTATTFRCIACWKQEMKNGPPVEIMYLRFYDLVTFFLCLSWLVSLFPTFFSFYRN